MDKPTSDLILRSEVITLNWAKPITLFLLVCTVCITNSFAQNWVQKGIDIKGESAGNQFGYSVSMSSDGNTVAIGARGNSRNGVYAGHVRVYSWNGSAWKKKGSDIDGEAEVDQSGWSVCMSADGNTVAIGAVSNDGNEKDAGQVRVFIWSGKKWTQKGADIDGEADEDCSGYSVSMSSDGNTVAIGAPFNDGNGLNAGNARVYLWNGSAWIQKGTNLGGEREGDNSGVSLSIGSDGNTVAIGAPNNDENGMSAGQVRVFTWNDSVWTQKGSDMDGAGAENFFGYSLSMSSDGNSVAIGAIANNENDKDASQIRVFTWDDSVWTQKGLDIYVEGADNQSRGSVSMSSDGNTVAIGAPFYNGTITQAGQVQVFSWNGTVWTSKGGNVIGKAALGQTGYSISMSSDGNTIAIGSPSNIGNERDSGHVRVLRF